MENEDLSSIETSTSRKRSASPARGREIKRKVDIAPGAARTQDRGSTGGATGAVTGDTAFEYRKRVIICHNLPGNHSGSGFIYYFGISNGVRGFYNIR